MTEERSARLQEIIDYLEITKFGPERWPNELREALATITALSQEKTRFTPNEIALIASVFSDLAAESAESEDVDKVAEAPMLRALARKAGLAVPVGHVVTFNQENLEAALTVARARITQLESDNEILKRELNRVDCKEDLLRAKVGRLRAAVTTYGQHLNDCEAEPHDYMGSVGPTGKPCTCGFEALKG